MEKHRQSHARRDIEDVLSDRAEMREADVLGPMHSLIRSNDAQRPSEASLSGVSR